MNKDKINFIVENSDNLVIYKIIKENNIPNTQNSNGIFINLSKLSEENINIIYSSIKNNSYKKFDNERNDLLKKYKKSFDINNNNNSNRVYKKFENLSEIDLEIIEYSKKDLNI
tara:strand:- start:46 stop:387 length:342 start_codon:yes stop_codon:yes gene_type:complete